MPAAPPHRLRSPSLRGQSHAELREPARIAVPRGRAVELRAQIVEHLLRGFGGTSGTMDDEVEVALLDAVAALHKRMHVVRLNGQGGITEAALSEPAAGVDDHGTPRDRPQRVYIAEAYSVEVRAKGTPLLRTLLDRTEDFPPSRHGGSYPLVDA